MSLLLLEKLLLLSMLQGEQLIEAKSKALILIGFYLGMGSLPWPFFTWGIDIIGKVTPKAENGHEYIVVYIDYFTKWVES